MLFYIWGQSRRLKSTLSALKHWIYIFFFCRKGNRTSSALVTATKFGADKRAWDWMNEKLFFLAGDGIWSYTFSLHFVFEHFRCFLALFGNFPKSRLSQYMKMAVQPGERSQLLVQRSSISFFSVLLIHLMFQMQKKTWCIPRTKILLCKLLGRWLQFSGRPTLVGQTWLFDLSCNMDQ